MRGIIGLVAVLGLASGLVGAFAYDQLGSDAGAVPPLQARELPISIIAGKSVSISGPITGAWVEVKDDGTPFRLPLDASRYPTGTYRLEIAGTHSGSDIPGMVCARLVEVTGTSNQPIAGSDVCSSQTGTTLLVSPSFSLPSGPHVYTLAVRQGDPSVAVTLVTTLARIIAEWTERR